jgi:hypothetical protein
MITPVELAKIAMPEDSLKVKHPKTGVEGYRVGLEVFHQLHCVNLLRQVTYKDYYMKLGNGNFASGEKKLQLHTGEIFLLLSSALLKQANYFSKTTALKFCERTSSAMPILDCLHSTWLRVIHSHGRN